MSYWLTTLVLLPMAGALLLCLVKGQAAKVAGLVFSMLTLALGVAVFVAAGSDAAALAVQVPWIAPIGAWFALSVDGMGAVMVLLTVILVPVVMIAEWNIGDSDGRWSTRAFFGLVLVLESLSLLVFLAGDALLFYLAFEATLIPMYFMIGGWGGAKRGRAAIKFLLFSLAGGLVMLVGIVGLFAVSVGAGTPSYLLSDLAALKIGGDLGKWLFAAFFFAFAVKAPMVGVHTWLPDTAEQASPGTSTLLVGVLDKIGTFGMIKFCLMLFPEASQWATPVVLIWALVSILYGAVMAIGSPHLMRLISFTSVSHFGFMVLGIFAVTTPSLTGSMFYMINHGFSTAALFLIVGFLIQRRGSAQVGDFGGVQKVAPVLAGVFLMAGLSALALPGMSSFVSEFLVTSGAFQRYPWHTGVAVLGVVLAAVYVLLAYQRTMTGPVTDQVAETVKTDLSARERLVAAPLLALILVFGFFPKPMLDAVEPTAKDTMSQVGVTDPAPQAVK